MRLTTDVVCYDPTDNNTMENTMNIIKEFPQEVVDRKSRVIHKLKMMCVCGNLFDINLMRCPLAHNTNIIPSTIDEYNKYYGYDKNFINLLGVCRDKSDPNSIYNRIKYYTKHYKRTDDWSESGYETYYLDEEIPEDYPRNQLHQYKKYTRQLEKKIKQLEKQLEELQLNR